MAWMFRNKGTLTYEHYLFY